LISLFWLMSGRRVVPLECGAAVAFSEKSSILRLEHAAALFAYERLRTTE
jgi:hypothetical protein